MTRQIPYKAILCTLSAGIMAGTLHAGDDPQNIKWNVLVLMTDMQSVHYIGSDHQSRENILTPNLDKLGEDGMVFRKAYDAFPVCAPTRASLLTGTYPMKHGQFGNSVYLTEAGPQGKTPSLAHLFRDNGYNTAMMGKQHSNMEEFENMPNGTLNGKNVFVGWNYRLYNANSEGSAPASGISPTDAEKQLSIAYQAKMSETMDQLKNDFISRYPEPIPGRPMAEWEKDLMKSSGTPANGAEHAAQLSDGTFAYASLDYLETFAGKRNDPSFNIDRTKPIFLFLSLQKPHYGFSVPIMCDGTEYWNMYSARPEDNNATYLKDGKPAPCIIPNPIIDSLIYEDPTSPYQYSRETYTELLFARAKYSACISWLDHMFGKVLDKLAELDDPNNPGKKLSETTIVCFTTDHGDMMGEKERINKMVSYEGSARVPFLIRMPGVITPGQKSDILLNHVDMFPTLAGLVGLGDKLSTNLDGKDCSQALLANDTTLGPQRSFTVVSVSNDSYQVQIISRTQNYKFTRWNNKTLGTQPAMLLFDMENDPYETKNLAYNPTYRNIVIEESRACDEFMNKFYELAPIEIPPLAQYTLTANADENGGSLTSNPPQGIISENSVVTLTAKANDGYKFVGWSGDVSKSTNTIELVMDGNKTVSANFAIDDNKTRIAFESPGSGTWIVPDDVYSVTIQAWGAGGAGGSAFCGEATANSQIRGGGGAGGSFAGTTVDVTPNELINYTIGQGGVGAAAGFAHQSFGETGGSTFAELNQTTIVSALGGPGGENVSTINVVYGGAGGIATKSGNIGNDVFYGGNGGKAGPGGTGGGGGSAGAGGNGGDGDLLTAGIAGLGGGAEGGTGTNLNGTAPTDGNAPGGGGAGAIVRNNTPFSFNNTHKTGAGGGKGMIIIAYEQTTVTSSITNQSNHAISIYPNPVNDKLYIISTDKNINKIELIDLTGKIVYLDSQVHQNQSIDLSGFESGLYIVKAYTLENIYSKKIIIK